jgi:hypothetical protein
LHQVSVAPATLSSNSAKLAKIPQSKRAYRTSLKIR